MPGQIGILVLIVSKVKRKLPKIDFSFTLKSVH